MAKHNHDPEMKIFVAIFRSHPLATEGSPRYVKDFRHNLSEWNAPWWGKADQEQRENHFAWALNHQQFHYSTDDLQKADWFSLDESDSYERAILEEFAPVDFIPVTMEIR